MGRFRLDLCIDHRSSKVWKDEREGCRLDAVSIAGKITAQLSICGGSYANNGDGSPWKYLNRNLATTATPNGQSQIFSYNSQGQLNQINARNADGSGGALLNYSVYRGDGKRAWKQSASGSRTYFFYDGDTLIGTSGDAANSSSVMLWG